MGKPAARLGDMTAHGGTITGPGVPTVLIGGMPAATMGDMHVCPMVTPGTPPIPHVGGPITLGSTGVLIGGKPAARMGDMAVCVGPPSTIILGCMTVLIGEVGSGAGGGGGGGGAGSGGGSAAAGALTSSSIAGKSSQADPAAEHFLDVTFQDKANLPIGGLQYKLIDPNNKTTETGVLAGQIKRLGLVQGNYTIDLRGIVNAQWSEKQAKVGSAVDLIVDTIGIKDGEKATLEVYIRDSNYSDHLLEMLEGKVQGDQVKASWTLQVDEKYLSICEAKSSKKRFSRPFFFFKISISDLNEQSGILNYQDWLEIKVLNKDGKPAANEDYILRMANGEIQKGKLDGNGHKKIENIDPSRCEVEFPNLPEVGPQ
jgi:uncharacterized Zn-binding protein involved in type VI secretion